MRWSPSAFERSYLRLGEKILNQGKETENRTGVKTRTLLGEKLEYDFSEGFPILTTKQVHFKSVLVELLWFLRGMTNINWLHKYGVKIWDEWATPDGELGPIYGKQWRRWESDGVIYDQVADCIKTLLENPDDRRIIINAWNVAELSKMKLPPCHVLYQFHVIRDELNLTMYQRSCDYFLGVPFNLSSAALLLAIMARRTQLQVGKVVWFGGNVHIYENHILQMAEQILAREGFELPSLLTIYDSSKNPWEIEPNEIWLQGYTHAGKLEGEVAR
jgi:thymidylate synthase